MSVTGAIGDVQERNSLSANEAIGRFKDGLKTVQDFEDFVQIDIVADQTQRIGSSVLDPLIKTTDANLLDRIANSDVIGDILRKTIYTAIDESNIESMNHIANTLPQIDLTDIIIQKHLKKAIEELARHAKATNNREIETAVDNLKNKLHKLFIDDDKPSSPKEIATNTSKKPAGNSPSTPHLAISKNPPPSAIKKLTLAISDKPPPLASKSSSAGLKRPQAKVNFDFLASMAGGGGGGSKTTGASTGTNSVRYDKSNTANAKTPSFDIGNLVDSISGKKKPTTDSITNKRNSDYWNDLPLSEDIPAKRPKKSTKKVQFASNLFEVRLFSRDMDEWNALFNHLHDAEAYNVDNVPRHNTFRRPAKLILRNVPVKQRIATPEAIAQQERERKALQAVYTQIHYIPPSPAEPDEPPVDNNAAKIPIIPLEDVDAMPGVEQSPAPAPAPVAVNSSTTSNGSNNKPGLFLTAEEISQLQNLAGTVTQQLQLKQQQQPVMTPINDTYLGSAFPMGSAPVNNNAHPSAAYQSTPYGHSVPTATQNIYPNATAPVATAPNYNITPNLSTTTTPASSTSTKLNPTKKIDLDKAIRNSPELVNILKSLSSSAPVLPSTNVQTRPIPPATANPYMHTANTPTINQTNPGFQKNCSCNTYYCVHKR